VAFDADAAFGAFGGIDPPGAVLLADGLGGAFGLASAAVNTFFGNFKCHNMNFIVIKLFLFKYRYKFK